MRRSMLVKLVLPMLVVAGVGLVLWRMHASAPAIPPALQTMGGDFALSSADGPVRLQDFRGKVVLVYFGYTHCPDVCPMALGVIAGAMRELPSGLNDRVAGIFISVDPRRDHLTMLQQYAAFFDKRIAGVTGTPGQIAKVAAAWRVGYSVPDAPADSNYAVEHSTFVYLVNPEGRVAALFDEKTNPDDIARAIRRWFE